MGTSEPRRFPALVESQLGRWEFKEESWGTDDPTAVRWYELLNGLPLPGRTPIEATALPPGTGVDDPSAFASMLDERARELASRMDGILVASAGVVARAIESFCEEDDEVSAPTASELLASMRLISVKLDMDRISSDEPFELMLEDAADLVGGHDLFIGLNERLLPVRASFDG
jgi:hypothetical protein